MGVKKYRSVADMGDTSSVDPRSPDLGRLIADVWAFNDHLASLQPVRGVHKFSSIDELNRHRERWGRASTLDT